MRYFIATRDATYENYGDKQEVSREELFSELSTLDISMNDLLCLLAGWEYEDEWNRQFSIED